MSKKKTLPPLYFCHCPENGIELFENLEQAKKRAYDLFDNLCEDASDHEWSEHVESLCYGKVLGSAALVSSKKAHPDSGFDEILDYEILDHWQDE